jgi:hypothetical protein
MGLYTIEVNGKPFIQYIEGLPYERRWLTAFEAEKEAELILKIPRHQFEVRGQSNYDDLSPMARKLMHFWTRRKSKSADADVASTLNKPTVGVR